MIARWPNGQGRSADWQGGNEWVAMLFGYLAQGGWSIFSVDLDLRALSAGGLTSVEPGYMMPAPHSADSVMATNPRVLCIGGEDHNLRIPFLHALAARGFIPIAAGTGELTPFVKADIEYRRYRLKRFVNPLSDWNSLGALSALITELRPDIIQSFDTKPNLLVPLAMRWLHGVPMVRTINGMGWLYSSRAPRALALRPVYRTLHQFAARSTAATVFQNWEDRRYFIQHRMVGRGGHRLIPGSGVDINGFDLARKSGPSEAELRDTLGLGAAEVIITVTRLNRQKGIATLLEAAYLVHQQRPTVRFLLVGPRESEGAFAVSQADIDRHAPYVVATGGRTDVPALLGLADVFAFPTEYREGVPRALLEAALAKLPIVTTAMPGCSDVVRGGWSGIVVPPRSPRALAAGILSLLCDRRAARVMANRASELVRADFGLDLTAARYAALYVELLASRCGSAGEGSGAR